MRLPIRECDVKNHKPPRPAHDALRRERERSGIFDDEDVTRHIGRVSEPCVETGRIVWDAR